MFILRYFLPAFALVVLFCVTNCSKSSNCKYVSRPSPLFFLLKKDGSRLPDSILDQLKVSYWEDGNKKYLSDFSRATEEGHDLGVVATRRIGTVSADQNIKTFYLEFPYGHSTDTLYVDYQPPSPASGCYYKRKEVKYNGQAAAVDSAITVQPVYLFNKL